MTVGYLKQRIVTGRNGSEKVAFEMEDEVLMNRSGDFEAYEEVIFKLKFKRGE